MSFNSSVYLGADLPDGVAGVDVGAPGVAGASVTSRPRRMARSGQSVK